MILNRRKRVLRTQVPAPTDMFPLETSSNGRYLQTPGGTPFLICSDAAWSLSVQLTRAQVDTYLDDRQAKGFTGIIWNLNETVNSSQSPTYRNREGNDPFVSVSGGFDTTGHEDYWEFIDYVFAGMKSRGMVAIVEPAYWGLVGEVYGDAVLASTDQELIDYGAWLANRYGPGSDYGNVIWFMGGDKELTGSDLTKNWRIVEGIRSVDPNALVGYHPQRGDEGPNDGAYGTAGALTGYTLNSIYTDGVEYDMAATEYARSPVLPLFHFEGYYDGESASAADCRRQAYASILSGCLVGHSFGNNPIWGFGEPVYSGGGGPANALATSLDTTATQQMAYVPALFNAFSWWLLEPKTDTSVISSSLSSGTSRICPALASDGSFGIIWVPSSQTVTLVKSAFSPSLIRVRLYDPTAGTYSTHTASTSNSGTLSVATGGERLIVVDAA